MHFSTKNMGLVHTFVTKSSFLSNCNQPRKESTKSMGKLACTHTPMLKIESAGLGWPPNAGIPLRLPRHKQAEA